MNKLKSKLKQKMQEDTKEVQWTKKLKALKVFYYNNSRKPEPNLSYYLVIQRKDDLRKIFFDDVTLTS